MITFLFNSETVMAASTAGDGDGDSGQRFESILIAPGKMKYMNPNFHKVQAKVISFTDFKLCTVGHRWCCQSVVEMLWPQWFACDVITVVCRWCGQSGSQVGRPLCSQVL